MLSLIVAIGYVCLLALAFCIGHVQGHKKGVEESESKNKMTYCDLTNDHKIRMNNYSII